MFLHPKFYLHEQRTRGIIKFNNKAKYSKKNLPVISRFKISDLNESFEVMPLDDVY